MSDEEVDSPGMGPGDDGDFSDEEPDDMPTPARTELPDGVQKEILTKGEGWKKPKAGDDVQVHYVGTLQSDGGQFDSSRERGNPFEFTLGKGDVIKGWDVGVASMLKGETAKFTLAPDYAYGATGSPPKIPANATLIFEVELLSWKSKHDLFGDEGCIKELVEEGTQTWKKPKPDGEVFLSMKATAEDGSVIEDRPGIDYTLGSEALGPISKVVDKALVGMAKSEKCILKCVKDYVYKESAHGKVTVNLHLQEIYTITDVSVAKDKSIMKKTIREGEGYEKPQDQDTVVLKVETVTDGGNSPLPGCLAPVDLSFEAYNGEVSDAIEYAVADMKKGERAVVTCTAAAVPKVAEAKLGVADIKADKVVLTLELLDLTRHKDVWNLGNEEKVALALKRKEQGGKLFSAKRFKLALEKYKKVEDAIASADNFADELKAKAAEVKKVAELNKAAAFLKLGDFQGVIASCDKVLKDDRDNVKALFRRGKARHERRDHLDAQEDLEKVIELDPSNSEAKALLQHVKRAQKLLDKQAKAIYAKMCSGLGKMPERAAPKAEPAVPDGGSDGEDD